MNKTDISATTDVIDEADEVAIAPEAQAIKEFLENVLQKMGMNCEVSVAGISEAICVTISGEDTNGVIGHHGEVLDALQYLSSLLLNGKNSSFRRVVLDTDGGYRAKREKTLQRLALNLEQKVKRTGKVAKLEPMNPYERRIIHTTLQNSKYVTTESEGQGNARHVVISPKGQSDVLNAPNAPRKTLNFVYRSDKKRR
ncbi:MAG: RNA-binding cell elongation regulator Jag/EloR [Candidatus Fimimonas sp.]